MKKYFLGIDYMNLQQISQLLNIDFSEMKLQSGFKKLSKNQYYIIPDCFIVKLSKNDERSDGRQAPATEALAGGKNT